MAWDAKWNRTLVETNCALALKWIKDSVKGQPNKDLISRIQELCIRKWDVEIKQIPWEVNCSPHILADLIKDFPIGLKLFHVAPPLVAEHIGSDRRNFL